MFHRAVLASLVVAGTALTLPATETSANSLGPSVVPKLSLTSSLAAEPGATNSSARHWSRAEALLRKARNDACSATRPSSAACCPKNSRKISAYGVDACGAYSKLDTDDTDGRYALT